MKKKKNKYESEAGVHFLLATNPKEAMNVVDKMGKKKAPPANSKRPRYPRDIDKNPRSRG